MGLDDWFGIGIVAFCWGSIAVVFVIPSTRRPLLEVLRSIPGEITIRLERWVERNGGRR